MNKSKSAIFLMELIIVIFFFTVTSAVCIRLFAYAHTTEIRTKGTNAAVLWADNSAELFYEYSDLNLVKSTIETDFKEAPYADKYDMAISFSSDDSFEYMEFNFSDRFSKEIYYSFVFKKHIKEVAK